MKRLVLALTIFAVVLCATAVSAQTYLPWRQSNIDGFGSSDNTASIWYGSLSGYLYLGTQNSVTGGQLYRSTSGYSWYKSGANGLGDANNIAVAPGATYAGALYVGTRNNSGAQLLTTTNGVVWNTAVTGGFGDVNNVFILPEHVYTDSLYVTTFNSVTGAEVWMAGSTGTWIQVNTDGFGDSNNREAYATLVHGGFLYAGTRNDITGGEMWRFDSGTGWTQVNTDGFGSANNRDAYPLSVFNNDLYVGTRNEVTGGEIWRSSDGTTWTQVNTDGFGDANNISTLPGAAMGGNLYAGTENLVTGGEVWRSPDGSTWTQVISGGFGDANNVKTDRLREFEGNIYIATENSVTGCEVWQGVEYLITDVYNVQQGDFPQGTNVRVDSVVCTAVDHKPTTFGFFAQELGGGPWSGVLCYSFGNRPDLIYNIEVGDMFTVIGEYQEYPEIGSQVTEIAVDDAWVITKDYGLPAPQRMSCLDLRMVPDDPADSLTEAWEGVYMYVDTVQVTEHRTYDEWNVQEYHAHPGAYEFEDSLIIDDKLVFPTLSTPAIGDTLLTITGVFSEEYGSYKLWARGLEDLVFMGPPPGPQVLQAYPTSETTIQVTFDKNLNEPSAENTDNYFLASETVITAATLTDSVTVDLTTQAQPENQLDSLIVCDVQSDIGFPMETCMIFGFMAGITDIVYVQTPGTGGDPDASQIEGERVTLQGVVTNSTGNYDGGRTFFIRDDTGPWNGIYIYYPTSDSVDVGDEVIVSGIVDEYYTMTELISVDYLNKIGTGNTVDPDIVTPYVLTDTLQNESWEGCFVMMECVEAFTERDEFGEWMAGGYSGDPDSVAIGAFGEYIHPGVGNLTDITGNFRFYQGAFKLEPRDTVDLLPRTAGVTPGDAEERPKAELRLYQNAPNPFGNGTIIRFAVPSKMRAQIAVYDVQGREVDVLTDSVMEPGSHQVQWNGTDRHGKQVSSGIYFYRFTTPNAVMHKKMVMLK